MLLLSWISALIALPAACNVGNAPQDQPPPGSSDNVLRIDVDCDFGPFCPHSLDCSGSTYIFPFIYSFLCVPNPEGELEPDLAVAWDYDPKTYTWRIRLREDARFHNGEPVTADDVLFSIRSHVEHKDKKMGEIIGTIKIYENHVIEIRMKQDTPELLFNIWDMPIIPDPSRHANLEPNAFPVGSGPFQFVGRGDDGSVILAANDNYYNGRPSVDRVVFYYVPLREDSWARLIKGETDVVGELTVINQEMIKQYADRFYFSEYFYNYYSILLYNTHHPLFENPLVRRALTHAIDRDYIVQKILSGIAEPVAGPIDKRSEWHSPGLEPPAYDPYLALEYLEKAGWSIDPQTKSLVKNGEPFAFELLLPSGSDTELRIARFIKLKLNEVGIRVNLKALPIDQLVKHYYRNREFEAVLTEFTASIRRPGTVLELWAVLNDTLSIAGGFDSPEANRLANQILDAGDPETRKTLFQQFDQLIADLHPGTFLFEEMVIDSMSKRFALKYPFSFSHYGFYWLQRARLKNE